MKETLAIIAAVLAVIGNTSYLKDVIKGTIQPHPYTWLIWSIVSLTTFFGGVVKGAGIGALPTGVAEAFTILIFLFALKNFLQGTAGKIDTIDHYFFAACLLGLIPWMFTKDPTISIIIVVLIDITAFALTLRKTWNRPKSERPVLYKTNVARHVLTLFSLETYNIATTFHSVAMMCANTVMVWVIAKGTRKQKVL
jgi:hypothetical protein